MKPSVIIPCWVNDIDTLWMTNDCIQSFRKSGDVELIIVDNASSIGSGELRSQADIYIHYPSNRGFTEAVNDGIKIANGEMIAWANNDIRIAPNWIDVCSSLLDDGVATVHANMIEYNEPFSFGELVEDNESKCSNSFAATKRRDFLFDENYGIGGGADDWDFAWRIRQAGLKRLWTNRTAFQHKNSFSLSKLPNREAIVDQNNRYFESKWGKPKEILFKEAGLI